MRRPPTWLVVSVIAVSLLVPSLVAAQGHPAVAGPVLAPALTPWRAPVPEAAKAGPAVRVEPTEEKKDYTVTGLLVGTGLGLVAGYAFYDVICEAVDNRCSDSRLKLLMLGAGVGGGLGALIGSVAE